MNGIRAFAGVARAPFLLLPPTLVASGAAAAAWDGAFSWPRTLLAVLGLVALHMAVNIFNEWSDLRTGIDLHTERTPFSGGSGTLPAGGMSLRTAFWFGVGCSAVGLAVGAWFISRVGWVLLPLFVAGAISVIAYTDVLARLGIGELAAGFGLGAGPVVGSALVQGGGLGPAALWVAIPAFLMTFNLLLLNEFPDEAADRGGGRRNLVLIFGRKIAAWIYGTAAVATPLVIVIGVVAGALPTPVLLGALPSLLLVQPLRWVVTDPSAPVPLPALGANVAWNLATNTLVAAGFIVAILIR
ncbi:MAG TPA: prenyltransferase [Chondromyces sp.]|nr:prenyltransferase [Chondromyces sp.]